MFTIRAFRVYFASVGRATLLGGRGRRRRSGRRRSNGRRNVRFERVEISLAGQRYTRLLFSLDVFASTRSDRFEGNVSRRKRNFSRDRAIRDFHTTLGSLLSKESKSDCVPLSPFHLCTTRYFLHESSFVTI